MSALSCVYGSSHKQLTTTALWRFATPVEAGSIHSIPRGRHLTILIVPRKVDRSFLQRSMITGAPFAQIPSKSYGDLMTVQRIDFKHVREHADFAAVIAAYGIELKQDGSKPDQFKALCPFHEDTKPSLKVNTGKNIFHCFSCEAKGNVLEFVMQMDNVAIRAAAKTVAELSGISPIAAGSASRKATKSAASKRQAAPETPASDAAEHDKKTENAVLSFELKLTQPDELTDWLGTRSINDDIIDVFGLGLASARSKTIAGRLAIPIHNTEGGLVGYCGRHVGDEVPDDVPKYILPKGFRKDLEVFNLHRLDKDQDYVVLFESYFSVMRHHGQVNCVSTFGRSISDAQIEALEQIGCLRVLIAFDGDQPGRDGAAQVAGQLASKFWTRIVHLDDGVKPHHLDWEELGPILRSAWQ